MTKHPGGLYAFTFEGREAFGLCTHEVVDGWGPKLGQFVRFFAGVFPEGQGAVPDVALAPVLFSAFVDLGGMQRRKQARLVGRPDVPEALAAVPRVRQGGMLWPGATEPEPFFLKEGLGDAAQVVEEPVSEEEMRRTPDEVVLDSLGVRDCYRFGLTPERKFDLAHGRDVFDAAKDAAF